MINFIKLNFLSNIIMFKDTKDSGLKLLWNSLVFPLCKIKKLDVLLRKWESIGDDDTKESEK
jgi:hypothetical protein